MNGKTQSHHPNMHNDPPSNVELHIGELVLQGFPSINQALLQSVIQQELSRIIEKKGAPANLGQSADISSLKGGEFHMEPNSSTQTIGAQIAQTIYGELNR